jgi:lysophospholipase L1-like esterase
MPSVRHIRRAASLTLACMGGLLILERFHPSAGSFPAPRLLGELVRTLCLRGLNQEDREGMAAGYYEGLLNTSAKVSSVGSLLTSQATRDAQWDRVAQFNKDRHRHLQDFLYFELLPNLDQQDFDGRLVTNSLGLADREYTRQKPAGTRRIALMGDSITRGLGAPAQQNYESMLEAELQQRHGAEYPIEVLNFSVAGYRITQMLEVACSKALEYDPDVLALCLTDLTVFRKWGHHLAQLVHDDIDLKYSFLKEIADLAGLRADDPVETFDAKLDPYRLPTLRAILNHLKGIASQRGAHLVVLLVPTVSDPRTMTERFLETKNLLAQLQIPTVDLLSTYSNVQDFAPLRIRQGDLHPNAAGHRLLFENLWTQVQASDKLREVFLGSP